MKVVIFTLCQNASNANGTLSLTNAFSNLLVPRVPISAKFNVVTRLYFAAREEGEFRRSLRLIDPDGQEIASSPIQITVKISDQDATGVFADSIGELTVTFRKAGEHQFQISGPDGVEFEIPLYVNASSR